MLLKGRRKIVTEFTTDQLRNFADLAVLLNTSRETHIVNKTEIDYLVEYKNGNQTILEKEKLVRPEINNKLVVNHAQMITRAVIGYFLGTPIQYIQNGANTNKEEVDRLNRYVAYEDKASVDKEIGEYQSICGTAYRIIYTDGALADEIPFEDRALNPATTYVVYQNNIAEKPLVGVTYHNIYDKDNMVVGVKIYAYTEFGLYTIRANADGVITGDSTFKFEQYDVGGVPIIEYPNNLWRIGDWELMIGLMDAIAQLHSGRLDDIDQIIQSLIVFINADIDETRYAEMREAGIVTLKNTTTNSSQVEVLNNSLEQNGLSQFSSELEEMLYALVGIPSRTNRSGGGGDTGQAVELRDGWADLEIVARNKELVFKKSEKQALRIILKILEAKDNMGLSLIDVDIKFSRNKNNNLLVKTQSYQTLVATKTLSPADCLTIVDLVSDVNEFIARGEAFWGMSFAGRDQGNIAVEQSEATLEATKNPPKETEKQTQT